jgi:hypothetical protein
MINKADKRKIAIAVAMQLGWDDHKAVALARWEARLARIVMPPAEYLERGRRKEATAWREGWNRYADCMATT